MSTLTFLFCEINGKNKKRRFIGELKLGDYIKRAHLNFKVDFLIIIFYFQRNVVIQMIYSAVF